MISDERDENFREMAALGNLKAVTAYIRGGVNIDGQNKMNGWSALHWACARGHTSIVALLIRAGADADVRNNKGQTPLDLCKSEDVRALFSASDAAIATASSDDAADGKSVGFTPNYLANPDLSKAWGVPDDALMPIQGDSGYVQQLQHEASIGGSNMRQRLGSSGAGRTAQQEDTHHRGISESAVTSLAPQSAAAAAAGTAAAEREVLVYSEQAGEANLLGSVLVPDANTQTVADLGAMIRNELDGIPEEFTIARYNGKLTIPISSKQQAFGVTKVFRGTDDAAVVVKKK